jgi:hypothetical protein
MAEGKPWRIKIGAAIGLAIGGLLWLDAYESGRGLFQNAERLLIPVVVGILVVIVRNWRKQVGPFDPDVQESNKQGRV